MTDSPPQRWHERIEAELTVALSESETILVAGETIDATLAGLAVDAPEDRFRDAASSLRTSAQQVAASALRIAAAAECLLLVADLAREEKSRGE